MQSRRPVNACYADNADWAGAESAMSTVYLLCGLPGSGKTTLAKHLEFDQAALRLTPDEWLVLLFGNDRTQADAYRSAIEALQWEVAARMIKLGINVVLDWGFWSRVERDVYRSRAATLGARAEVRFLDARIDELSARLEERRAGPDPGLHVSEDELALWSKLFEPPTTDELE